MAVRAKTQQQTVITLQEQRAEVVLGAGIPQHLQMGSAGLLFVAAVVAVTAAELQVHLLPLQLRLAQAV